MTDERSPSPPARAKPRPIHLVFGGVALAGMIAIAWARMGALGLPSVPSNLDVNAAGLDGLYGLSADDAHIRPERLHDQSREAPICPPCGCPVAAAHGYRNVKEGHIDTGLEELRSALRAAPTNLAVANVYRITMFELQRDFLREARKQGNLTPQFPPNLADEPIRFFQELCREHGTRETKLALALAWVDKMLLFPALEIKAPSSVESVDILTDILEHDPYYVPALFARGLNHLHRPARLVWPKAAETPIDAAAQDIAKCVAIGRKVGAGSARLQATLAIALGDSYVKAGRLGVARSWWQIAQNLCGDDDLQQSIRRRYGWSDGEVLDRLEEELDRARAQLDRPMTDLAMMWN